MTRRPLLMTTIAAMTLLGLSIPAVPAAGTELDTTTSLGAADGVRYSTSTSQLAGSAPLESTTDVTAKCRRAWATVGGGQTVQARSEQGINASSADDGGWYAGSWQHSDTESRLASFVVCMQTEDLSSVTTVAKDVPADAPVTGAALCTQGSAVSGELSRSGEPADFVMNSSYPIDGSDPDLKPDDGWRSRVDYTGDGGDSVYFGVRCLENTPLAYRSATVKVAPGALVSTKALCPTGLPVVGGGVFVTGVPHASHVVASRPWDSKDANKVPEDGWRGGVFNTSASKLSITVHAVCRAAQLP